MSEVKNISITRALIELKRFDSRITQAITSGTYAVITRGQGAAQKVHNSQRTVDEAKALINGSFQAVESLIRNREEIKAAIVKSNAETYITFRGRQITVAAAIELKSSVATRELFLNNVRRAVTVGKTTVVQENAKLDAETATLLVGMFGADKSKYDASQVQAITNAQLAAKESSLLNADLLDKKIAEMESEILDIKSEIDFLLTESNSATQISVNL